MGIRKKLILLLVVAVGVPVAADMVALSLAGVIDPFRFSDRPAFIGSLAVAVIVFIVGLRIIDRGVVSRLDAVSRAARRVGEGDFTGFADTAAGAGRDPNASMVRRVASDLLGEDEISGLVRDFDRMARSLHQNYRELESRVAARTAELERANRDLSGSEARFRAIAQSAADAIVSLDHTGQITAFNSAAEKMFGCTRGQALGRSVAEFVPERYHRSYADALCGFMGGSKSIMIGSKQELHGKARNGREFPIEVSVSTYRLGETPEFTAIVRDVTDRKAAEEALRESEERYRSVVDALEEGILVADSEGVILTCNKGTESVLGLPSGQIIGSRLRDPRWNPVHENGAPFLADEHPSVVTLNTGRPCSNVIMGIRKADGEQAWLSVNSRSLMRPGAAKPHAVVVSFSDITRRRQAEEALRESEQQYKVLFESNPHPMWVYDFETLRYLAVNDTAVRRYGYSREEFLAMTIGDIRPSEELGVMKRALASIDPEGFYQSGGWKHKKKDGTLIDVEVTSHGITFGGRRARLVLANDITERKRAEENLRASEDALRRSEQRLRVMIDQMPAILWTTDADLKFTSGMGAALPTLNLKANSLDGLSLQAYFGTDDPAFKPIAAHRRALAGQSMSYEMEWAGHHFQTHVEPLRDAEGRVIGTVGVALDITEAKRAAESVRRSEERFRALVENGSEIVSMLTAEPRVQYISPAVRRALGIAPEEYVGHNPFEYIHPDDHARSQVLLGRLLAEKGGEVSFDCRHRHGDGGWRHIEGVAANRLDEPAVKAIVVNFRDVTQREQAVQALRDGEALYHSLVENLPQHILRKDLEGRFTFGNRRFCDLLGVTPEQLIGKTDRDFFSPQLAEKYRADDRRVIETGRTLTDVEEVAAGGSRMFVQVVKTPLSDSAGRVTGLQIIFWDITENKRLEDDLRRRTSELEQANRVLRETQAQMIQQEKLASLGQLTAGVAHEVNNPLAFVINNLAVLERDQRSLTDIMERYRGGLAALKAGRPELADEISRAEAAIDIGYTMGNLDRLIASSRGGLKRVQQIVADLRQFSRLDRADREQADLDHCLQTTLQILAFERNRRSLEVVTDYGGLSDVTCYPQKINQVFLNILMNAIQASGEGKRLWVGTRRDGDEAVVEIRDEGCGMPPEVKKRIFDPFFTTKPPGEGTGLGLSICYGIVRDHFGRIEVETEVGKGTLFRVVLPMRPPEGADALPADVFAAPAAREGA